MRRAPAPPASPDGPAYPHPVSTTPERADARADLRALRERLNDLTLHDAHRLGRRLERLRGARSERPLERFEAEVAAAEERIALRRAARAGADRLPGRAARQRAPRGSAADDPRAPGRRRRGRDRLRQVDAAAEAVPGAGPRRARDDRAHAAAPARRAHDRRARRGGAPRAARRRGRLRGPLRRQIERRDARAADDRRPAAGGDPARPAAAPLRHDHRRRGARALAQHRLPARRA